MAGLLGSASWTPAPRSALTDVQRQLMRDVVRAEERVHQVYPGPVAETLACELRAYLDHGYRFDATGHTARLVAEILARPVAS